MSSVRLGLMQDRIRQDDCGELGARTSYVSTRSFMFMVSAYGGSGVGILEGTFFTQRAKRRESGVM